MASFISSICDAQVRRSSDTIKRFATKTFYLAWLSKKIIRHNFFPDDRCPDLLSPMARMFRVLLFCNKCYQMILKKPRMILGAPDHIRLILLIPGLLETVPHIAKKCHLGRDAQLYGRLSSIFLCGIKDPDICPILRIPESSDRSMFLCFRDRRSKK